MTMTSTKKQKQKRRQKFAGWWKRNHHHTSAHIWLSYHARNWAYTYALPPESFSEIQRVTKRFFKSEHKRLSQNHAWYLWKVTHPLLDDRIAQLAATAGHLSVQKAELKQLKKELKDEQMAL